MVPGKLEREVEFISRAVQSYIHESGADVRPEALEEFLERRRLKNKIVDYRVSVEEVQLSWRDLEPRAWARLVLAAFWLLHRLAPRLVPAEDSGAFPKLRHLLIPYRRSLVLDDRLLEAKAAWCLESGEAERGWTVQSIVEDAGQREFAARYFEKIPPPVSWYLNWRTRRPVVPAYRFELVRPRPGVRVAVDLAFPGGVTVILRSDPARPGAPLQGVKYEQSGHGST